MSRTFRDTPAVREKTPLLVGLVGPSGTGKTFSALRLATGIQQVTGGEVFFIDTEARRALHYADRFKFRHVAFGAPFAPLDYLEAIKHCLAKGAKTIIVDSFSHEHEGPGGVLEMHAAEVQRMSGGDRQKAERVKMLAWQKPKADRRRLINSILQMECNFVFCFRAKPKMKIVKGKDPVELGYMPIAGDEFVYEMTLKCLLLPGSNGVPVLQSQYQGESGMIKVPEQFRSLLNGREQLSESTGKALAEWSEGGSANARDALSAAAIVEAFDACSDHATFRALDVEGRRTYEQSTAEEREQINHARGDALARLERDESYGGEAEQSTDEKEAS